MPRSENHPVGVGEQLGVGLPLRTDLGTRIRRPAEGAVGAGVLVPAQVSVAVLRVEDVVPSADHPREVPLGADSAAARRVPAAGTGVDVGQHVSVPEQVTVGHEREDLSVGRGQDEAELVPAGPDEPARSGVRPGRGSAGGPVDVPIPVKISVGLNGVNNSVATGHQVQEPLLRVVGHIFRCPPGQAVVSRDDCVSLVHAQESTRSGRAEGHADGAAGRIKSPRLPFLERSAGLPPRAGISERQSTPMNMGAAM